MPTKKRQRRRTKKKNKKKSNFWQMLQLGKLSLPQMIKEMELEMKMGTIAMRRWGNGSGEES